MFGVERKSEGARKGVRELKGSCEEVKGGKDERKGCGIWKLQMTPQWIVAEQISNPLIGHSSTRSHSFFLVLDASADVVLLQSSAVNVVSKVGISLVSPHIPATSKP